MSKLFALLPMIGILFCAPLAFATSIDPFQFRCGNLNETSLRDWQENQITKIGTQKIVKDFVYLETSQRLNSPQLSQIKGVAMVIHGLGQRPSSMAPWVKYLEERNIVVYGVALPGHRGSAKEARQTRWQDFLRETLVVYCYAKQTATELGVPLIGSGISNGGLSLQAIVDLPLAEDVNFDQLIYFSPALKLPDATLRHAVRFLPLLPLSGGLLARYHRKDTVPIFAAANEESKVSAALLLSSVKLTIELRKSEGFYSTPTPTLIIADPEDKVVDIAGIQEETAKHSHIQWKNIRSGDLNESWSHMHHLTLGEVLIGDEQWQEALNAADEFLGLSSINQSLRM